MSLIYCLAFYGHIGCQIRPYAIAEFMVDSGSDVVTVREEVLQELDLQLLGTIQSRGVHSTKQKQLYKAVLKIGDVEVETEVIDFQPLFSSTAYDFWCWLSSYLS